jgi:RNA polymerase sigma factor (sigma-70 family)
MQREWRADTGDGVQRVGGSIDEPRSFESAFDENFEVIHRFLARRVGSGLADDLAAETFVVAYRRRASFDPARGEVRPWLFGIATVLLRAHWRQEQQLLALEARLAREPGGPGDDTEQATFAAALAPQLADALSRLSAGHRDVLLLHAWGELSSDEIAAALGLRAATVRSRLSRARAQLRGQLGDFDLAQRLSSGGSEPLMEECRK